MASTRAEVRVVARLVVDDRTRAALEALGWTPPLDGEEDASQAVAGPARPRLVARPVLLARTLPEGRRLVRDVPELGGTPTSLVWVAPNAVETPQYDRTLTVLRHNLRKTPGADQRVRLVRSYSPLDWEFLPGRTRRVTRL